MKTYHISFHPGEVAEIQGSEKIAEADQMMAVIAIARKSTTEKETATTTPVAEAEAQGAKIEDGARGVEVSQIGKAEVVNLVSIGITGLQRDREEAGAVAAITRENPATITLVDEILQAAIQTGFDIRQTLNAAYDSDKYACLCLPI